VHPMEHNNLRANTVIKCRVSERLKAEWAAHADKNGIALSDFVRTACRLAILVGHSRLAEGLTDITCIRRDLHVIGAELRQIADDNPRVLSAEVRSVLARVHLATETVTASIHPGGSK
jgi:hypothetical protein